MNSRLLVFLGIVLLSITPFAFAKINLIEFTNLKLLEFYEIVYEDSINSGDDFLFSFYEGMEYVEKKDDSMAAKNQDCSIDQEKSTSNTIADQPEFEKIVYKRSINNIENSISSFMVDLEYFRMKGDSTVANNFNCLIDQIIYQEKLTPNSVSVGLNPEEYMQIAIQGFEKHRRNFPNDRGYTQQTKSEVIWSDEKLISMELITYRYTGGAHGHTYHEFLNIDPKNGERIYIFDFIIDKEAFTTSVHEKLITALPDGQKQMWNQVRLPRQMGMTKAGLKLVYNEYEILSYGAGRTVILIPMNELKTFSVF